ncbi:hypothetical protein [Streptomyces canus]|uniref:hypothetical protein n=1 Tax=Streptomyces canus TaxID=58343 RepID=UPI003253D53F
MHPIPVIRAEDRDSGPWPLISEDMDGEPRWVHPDVTATRVPQVRATGKRVRRDQLEVPDSFGEGMLCLIDRNGSYPSACSAVPLAPNKLLHTGPLDAYDKAGAGIYLIDIPERTRTDMPHPLGRITDRPDDDGRVRVTTPHIKQLAKLVREGHLAAASAIHDSWTGKANESLFKPFYEATRKARTEVVQVGGDPPLRCVYVIRSRTSRRGPGAVSRPAAAALVEPHAGFQLTGPLHSRRPPAVTTARQALLDLVAGGRVER